MVINLLVILNLKVITIIYYNLIFIKGPFMLLHDLSNACSIKIDLRIENFNLFMNDLSAFIIYCYLKIGIVSLFCSK